MSLRQAFAHCAIFLTAASRRSLDRVSVPMWPYTLSGRLTIIALVGRYPTNKLIVRELILQRQHKATFLPVGTYAVLSPISRECSSLKGRFSRVTHPSAAVLTPEGAFSLDLHVLSTPPAFILSQDQTLHYRINWICYRDDRNFVFL